MNRNTGTKATRMFCSSRPKFGRRDTRETTRALLATRPARPPPKYDGRESFPQFRGSYLYGLLVKYDVSFGSHDSTVEILLFIFLPIARCCSNSHREHSRAKSGCA